MKIRYSTKVFTCFLLIISMFCSLIVFQKINVNAATTYTVLPLGANVPGTVANNTETTYKFTAPETGYYVVETYGYSDTYGILEKAGSTLEDDDSGYNTNFCIGFELVKGTFCYITVQAGSYQMQSYSYTINVRKQKGKFFVYNYPDGINTGNQAAFPNLYMSNLGYECTTFYNEPSSTVFSLDINYRNLNSEIFFISGHGGVDVGSSTGNVYVQCYDGNSTSYINSYLFESQPQYYWMGNVKLALWNSCQSGTSNSSYINLADASVEAGAKCAIGWDVDINPTSAFNWTNKFFLELKNGATVNNAANAADNILLPPYDNCKDNWVAKGNKYITIHSPYVYPKGSYPQLSSMSSNMQERDAVFDKSLLNEFNLDRIRYNYKGFDIKGGIRYYKTINGYLTDDFYDIYDNGTIKKSLSNYDEKTIILMENALTEKKINMPDYEENESGNTKKYVIIVTIEGSVIPVYVVSESGTDENGFGYNTIDCKNLLNGDKLDYSDICVVHYKNEEVDCYD